MDQVFRLYCATIYSAACPLMRPLNRASSFGYRKWASVDGCSGVLFELICVCSKWGMVLVIAAKDIRTAFDSVEHVEAINTLSSANASRHQVLALSREMQGKQIRINVPGIAKTDGMLMSKALKTGGRIESVTFTRMFDEIFDQLETEWDSLGYFYSLPDLKHRFSSVIWADNNFILSEFICNSLSEAIRDRFTW